MRTYSLMLSQVFPKKHSKEGERTNFSGKLTATLNGFDSFAERKGNCYIEHTNCKKLHTIRANYEFWKKRFEQIAAGEACLSIRQWVGKPYGKGSTQREIVRLTREDGIGIQRLMFDKSLLLPHVNYKPVGIGNLANNDGLSLDDWNEWFKHYDLSQPMAIIHFTPFRY